MLRQLIEITARRFNPTIVASQFVDRFVVDYHTLGPRDGVKVDVFELGNSKSEEQAFCWRHSSCVYRKPYPS